MDVGSINVKDINNENIDDVFTICSYNRMDDPIQQTGIELKRKWIKEMLNNYGSCTKIAYYNHKPVAQILFFSESSVPYLPEPREKVILLHCVYNPFPEARGKGAATALIKSLISDCENGIGFLDYAHCNFIASEPFDTSEGISLSKFYESNGFVKKNSEMILEIAGKYKPKKQMKFHSFKEDRGKALVFYNPICEWSYYFALKMKNQLEDISSDLPIKTINQWEEPQESMRRGNHWLVVNGMPIEADWRDQDEFKREVLSVLEQ